MKKTLLSFGACLAFLAGTAQTQLFFEDFESTNQFTLNSTDVSSTATGYNEWVVNNSYAGGSFVESCIGLTVNISPTTAQPAGISSANGNYAHILADDANFGGVTNANFIASDGGALCNDDENYFIHMTNDITTGTHDNVTVNFWWLCAGGAASYGELYYSTDGGSSWTKDNTISQYNNQTTWQNETITNAAWDGQTNLRFGFRFVNLFTTAASDPSLAFDDFEITGTVVSGCTNTTNTFSETACLTYTVPSGDETYNTAGTQTVMDTIPNAGGCDSVLTINLTIDTIDLAVTDNMDGSITADAAVGSFQWLDCDNAYAQLSGETNATYTATSSGNYAVEVTNGVCLDTSVCTSVTIGGFDELGAQLDVYPNPNDGQFTIEFGQYNSEINLIISDMSGQILMEKAGFVPQPKENMQLNVAPGIYILSIKEVGTDVIRKVRITVE